MNAETHLKNALRGAELEIEDFAVLSPRLICTLRNCGAKTLHELEKAVKEKGLKPGTWYGSPQIYFLGAIDYYKKHKKEVCRDNPPVYLTTPFDITIQKAVSSLVDAVDRYTMGRCLRSELLNKNNELKRMLNDNQTTPTPLVQV